MLIVSSLQAFVVSTVKYPTWTQSSGANAGTIIESERDTYIELVDLPRMLILVMTDSSGDVEQFQEAFVRRSSYAVPSASVPLTCYHRCVRSRSLRNLGPS